MGKSKKIKAAKARKDNYNGPLHTVRDRLTGVHVALYEDDRGTPELLRKVALSLAEFVDEGTLPFPLKGEEASINGRVQSVKRLKDGIDMMFEKGSITDAQLLAAREFQAVFEMADRIPVGSIMYGGNGGGGGLTTEDFLQRRIKAAEKVERMIGMAKMAGTPAALAVERIAGRGWTLRAMQAKHGQNTHYWRSSFRCGLQCIVTDYLEGRRNPRLGQVVDVIA